MLRPEYALETGNIEVTNDISNGDKQNEVPFFTVMSELVEHCREHGIMLVVRDVEHRRALPSNYAFVSGEKGEKRSLWRCSVLDNSRPAKRSVPALHVDPGLLRQLNEELNNEDSDARRISNLPVNRAFAYLDVSDFSQFIASQQALVINALSQILNDKNAWPDKLFNCYETMLCIGDGYIFVLKDPVQAARFSACLATIVEVFVAQEKVPIEFHFRMGLHYGPVYSFWYPGRKNWNYVGDGINGGSRVLSAIGKDVDDVIFISWQVRQKIVADLQEANDGGCTFDGNIQNRGRKKDKHGKPWRVFELDHLSMFSSKT